jgi:hypothetical protein
MKTKNLDECDESKSFFAVAAHHRNYPFSKTTPFAEISQKSFKRFPCSHAQTAGREARQAATGVGARPIPVFGLKAPKAPLA